MCLYNWIFLKLQKFKLLKTVFKIICQIQIHLFWNKIAPLEKHKQKII